MQVIERARMMNDSSGHTSLTPFAQYDPDTQSWKTSQVTSLLALTLSSLTLPKSGGLQNGELTERPMLAHPTAGNGYSSLLATPTTMDDLPAREGEAYEKARLHGGRTKRAATGNLREQVIHSLPTPHAGLGERGRDGVYPNPKGQQDLQHTLATLLPTPAVNDMGAGKDPQAWNEWAARQKAADGRPAPHGKSLEQEALTMLPTPKATNNENQQNLTDYGPNLGMALMPEQYDWSVAGRLKEVQLMGTPTAAMSVRSNKFKRSAQNPAEFAESMQDKLLPTPTTDMGRQSGECRDFGADMLHAVTCEKCQPLIGESTPPQSNDGSLF